VGSGRERPGRTGFAHLFEHIMFEGSAHVPEGAFDQWLEAVGGSNNGSTNNDRTNYWENAPAGALELPLFLESDRMGHLLPAMSPAKVDGQRDVVKNERRQSYENRPYGMADLALPAALYPPDHPYHWPTIGSMEDLTAASYQDVVDFFKTWYGPANASVVIAGDVDVQRARRLAEKWFGQIPRSARVEPLAPRPVVMEAEKRLLLEDRVELPRLYMAWHTPPHFAPAEAALVALGAILSEGKNSRLYKRLVYELQVAQDVSAFVDSGALAGTFNLVVTARAGRNLEEIRRLVDEEIARLRAQPPAARELERFQNQSEARVLRGLERVGGFGGKADQLNQYFFYTGNPDFFAEELAGYRALAPADVRAVAQQFLGPGRVVLSVVPAGKPELGVPVEAKQ
ncbi:MAG TPA: pitrilysin family protein, partial [Vicinamibacteria bacterium]|nr:pitrilysin family protein [Vicinamibacteria bacterium]